MNQTGAPHGRQPQAEDEQSGQEDAIALRRIPPDLMLMALEHAPVGILVVDWRTGEPLYANAHLLRLCEDQAPSSGARAPGEAAGPIERVRALDRHPAFADLLQPWKEEHPGPAAEKEIQLASGRVLRRNASWLLGQGGDRIARIAFFENVTERTLVESALREREDASLHFRERLVALLECHNDLLRAETTEVLFRRAVELGVTRLGFGRIGIWFVDDEAGHAHGCFGVSETGDVRDERDRRIAVPNGSLMGRVFTCRLRALLAHGVPLRNDYGQVVGRGSHVVAALWDGERVIGAVSGDNLTSGLPLTEEDREVLALYASTVGHLHARMHAEEDRLRAEQLAAADRQKDEFLAMLAHELRNPMAAAAGALDVLGLRRLGNPELEHARDVAARQVRQMSRLLEDLLDLSRIAQGALRLHKEAVPIATIIDNAIETVAPLVRARGHALSVSAPSAALMVDADPVRLTQVLVNLINNAAKYTPIGGRITVCWEHDGGEIVLRVRDNGIGIPEASLSRVFDLFVQGQAPQGGLGIGLALVRRLVALHGGSVDAFSDGPGKGSEFVVRLPTHEPTTAALPTEDGPVVAAAAEGAHSQDALPAAGRIAEAPEAGRGYSADWCSRRVLVVDDDQDGAEMLAQVIETWGYEVIVACDGDTALAMAAAYQPDVVFLDMVLPAMDGWEVARRMRMQPALEGTILVALTGFGDDAHREQASGAGISHYLVKPVNPVDIESLLATALPDR